MANSCVQLWEAHVAPLVGDAVRPGQVLLTALFGLWVIIGLARSRTASAQFGKLKAAAAESEASNQKVGCFG